MSSSESFLEENHKKEIELINSRIHLNFPPKKNAVDSVLNETVLSRNPQPEIKKARV